jgi:ADP-ribose pyrophosphatase YjhB (NUDIX family)
MTIVHAKPLPGVSVMTVRDGKVLLAKRAKTAGYGMWSLPGGHIESGEALRDAALRELREETGVVARLERLIDCMDIIHHNDDDTVAFHYIISVFLGRWVSGEAVAASDASDVLWADASDLEQLTMTHGTADLIKRTLKDLTQS